MPLPDGAGVGGLCRVVICRPSVPELGAVDLPTDEETGGWELTDALLGGLLVMALLGLLLGGRLIVAPLDMLLLGARLVMALPELTLLGARLVIARLDASLLGARLVIARPGLLLCEMLLELLGDGALGVALGEEAGLETCRLC